MLFILSFFSLLLCSLALRLFWLWNVLYKQSQLDLTLGQTCVTFPSPARGTVKTYSSWKSKLKAGCLIILSSTLPRSIRTELEERETTMNAQHRHYQPARLKLCVCLPRLKRSIYCSDSQQMLGVLIHSCLLYHSKQFVLPPYPRTSKSTTFIKKKKKRVLLFFKNLFPSCPSWLKNTAHSFVLYYSKSDFFFQKIKGGLT